MRGADGTHAEALAALNQAFHNGYDQAKRQMASSGLRQLGGIETSFQIDVPEQAFQSDAWKRHCLRFSQLGRVAALAVGIDGNAWLRQPDPSTGSTSGLFRWLVELEVPLKAPN